MPRRISVRPTASHTRTLDGNAIIAAPARPAPAARYPSAEGRLPHRLGLRDAADLRSWGTAGSVHERDNGHAFAGPAAAPVVA